MDILCSYPTHAANSSAPGWSDRPLAQASKPVALICPGCAHVRDEEERALPPAPTLEERIAELEGRVTDIEKGEPRDPPTEPEHGITLPGNGRG